MARTLNLEGFSEEMQQQSLQAANIRFQELADAENSRRTKYYQVAHANYCLAWRACAGDPKGLVHVTVPEVPKAQVVVPGILEGGILTIPELMESETPLVDPPLALPQRKEYPADQAVFGNDMAPVGYPGWYASSKQLPDRSVVSTSVPVGTVSQGPDGKDYVLTSMGFGGLAKYWVRKE